MEYNLNLKEVGGHTFAVDLISDGVIIDVGARGFIFSNANEFIGKKVYCIDPDPRILDVITPDAINQGEFVNIGNMVFMTMAISDKAGDGFMYLNESCPEGTTLKEFDPDQNHKFTPCKTITMDDLYAITGENVDVLKLDCEGAEYVILGETFRPIPKQISCEMHFHCVPELHNKHFESIKQRLSEHYEIFNDVAEPRHGCGNNWWDILWIRKDLLS